MYKIKNMLLNTPVIVELVNIIEADGNINIIKGN